MAEANLLVTFDPVHESSAKAEIEGLFYQTTDKAQFTSTATWSAKVLTVVDAGTAEIGLVINIT